VVELEIAANSPLWEKTGGKLCGRKAAKLIATGYITLVNAYHPIYNSRKLSHIRGHSVMTDPWFHIASELESAQMFELCPMRQMRRQRHGRDVRIRRQHGVHRGTVRPWASPML
jgi:hypothetical protein